MIIFFEIIIPLILSKVCPVFASSGETKRSDQVGKTCHSDIGCEVRVSGGDPNG